jgi:signal transduction histidine kinase
MGNLLYDLLTLSRIGRVVNPPEEIDLTLVAREALEMLDERLRVSKVTVKISPHLPVIYADRVRMREVMENLIDNAAKYMGDQPHPRIEIGGRDNGVETVIYVKDNGMGIEPQFQEKIFGLFEKLNVDSEGTGIGLAMVKRIVETHGGRIWVESEGLGKGATFWFTLPASLEDRQNLKPVQP